METADAPLESLLEGFDPEGESEPDRDLILERFLEYAAGRGLELYAAQEEAILELLAYHHVVLNTPTGSGKSLVAEAMHFQAMAEGRVSYYTAPTKALVNEKFFALCDAFGPRNVALLTGDATVNQEAPVVCCTMEILSNLALRDDAVEADYVAMDEFHFYGDPERGVAWQIPLITLRDTVFLLMSATLGDTSEIEQRLESFTGRKVASVRGGERPVPLSFSYRDTVLQETVEDLVQQGDAPIYLVNFTQRDCAEQAQALTSINVCSKEDKHAIGDAIAQERFDTPYGKEFKRFLRHGIGVHHAGLLPRYRRIIERLAQTGLVKVISGTDTLGVGVNIPIRTVLIRQLYKYDGEKSRLLTAREFHQIAGRAGRKGFDDRGRVVVQAPAWVIENRRIKAKIEAQPHLKKKLVLKKPPPRAVPWDRGKYQKLVDSPPEPLVPQFQVSHGMLINLLQNDAEGGYRRLIELIGRSHADDREQRHQRRRAASLFRSLVEAGIVEIEPAPGGPRVRVAEELQYDFSLNHTLSLYLVETLSLLDPEAEDHALDMLSLVESILEHPRVVLYRQVDKIKGELVARLKAEGVEYAERMEKLEMVEHPKPKADFIYETFNAFARAHPWVGDENIRPKSVAREMFERLSSFNDYVTEYGLARSEGVLLRYLSQVYKTAVQNIPEPLWTEDFEDILAYLHDLVRSTDASLIEEWQLLVTGPQAPTPAPAEQKAASGPALDPRALRAAMRNQLHMLLGAFARRDYADACARLVTAEDEQPWTPERLEAEMAPYWEEHAAIDITPRARMGEYTVLVDEGDGRWSARQRILDPEEDEDWAIYCKVDPGESPDPSAPLLQLDRIGR